ncbi:tRNA intron endonuclease [Fimicolochytrium jonesii]|uniref:tRNA intron endonuclease n=1 Tax=Fimicolochytrium jonesii TaxID=1396493 RepID=UPI0022FE408B|nr:tRNA intron endonuclease [Fimicolochytrium jonesii]KAI8822234.1 tRNA intron endonuclease [Fimicolochytrium jonesii]
MAPLPSHPLYIKFLEQCVDSPPRVRGLSFQVYTDLLLAKQWWSVQPIDVPSLDKIVLVARSQQHDKREWIIPMNPQENWSMEWLSRTFANLSSVARGVESVVLAIVSTDATIVYYRIHKGLVPPKETKEA